MGNRLSLLNFYVNFFRTYCIVFKRIVSTDMDYGYGFHFGGRGPVYKNYKSYK